MPEDAERIFTPRLRFPEFQEKWSSKLLGRVFSERQETGFSELPLLSLTEREGIIPQKNTNRKNNSNSDKAKYLRVVPGDIAYNTMRMWEGRSAHVGFEGLVSPAYTVCQPSIDTNSPFFAFYFKVPSLIRQFKRYSQGLVKDTLNLKYEAFARIPVGFPQPAEQQKIADCLASLDEIIAVQERKVAALNAYKKELMHQLFPRTGETIPLRRFPEFRNGSEWKEVSLGQIINFQSGGTPSKANPAFWNGSIPWVSAKDMKQLILDDTEDHITTAAVDDGAKQVPASTVLMLVRGMTLLNDVPICILRCPMSFNQDIKAIQSKGDLDRSFLPYLLLGNKQRLLSMVNLAGHGTGRLDTEDLKMLAVMLPEPPEQQRIAECLSSLHALIPVESKRLAAFKAHKKGLMQRLFPLSED